MSLELREKLHLFVNELHDEKIHGPPVIFTPNFIRGFSLHESYFAVHAIFSSRKEDLFVDLRLEEDCDGPILEDLEFWLNEKWIKD